MATTAENPSPQPPKLLGTDAWIGFGTIAGCLALILGLRLIAHDAPSAGRSIVVGIPTPIVSAAAGCANFAQFWMDESGANASAETIEGISNCRRSADGTWFIPSGPDDPRLPNPPTLSPDERSNTTDLRAEILAQIADLEAAFPTTLRIWLNQLYDPFPRAVIGHIREGPNITTARNRYRRLTQAYLMAPNRRELADYVAWIMARRIRAYDDLKTTCLDDPDLQYLRTACEGLEDSLSIRHPPFIWDLEDPLLLDAYLVSTLTDPEGATPSAGVREPSAQSTAPPR